MEDQQLLDKIERLQVVGVKPGDTIVLTMHAEVSPSDIDRLHMESVIKRFFDQGVKVLVLTRCDLSIIRSEVA